MKFKIRKLRQEIFDTIVFPGPPPTPDTIFLYGGIYYKVIYVVYDAKKEDGVYSGFDYQNDICGTLTVTEVPEL